MINVFLSGLLATLALAQQTDTTVQVQAGARLRLDNPGGLVTIRTWERNAMRVRADHSRRATIEIRNSGAVVILGARSERGPGSIVDYELTIPSSMHLELNGDYSDFDVQGVGGQVSVRTLEGDISVSGGSERIRLVSVHGSIELSDASGEIKIETVNDAVRVARVSGSLTAETVNGRITLEDTDLTNVEATTFNGSITYDGPIHDDGNYWFATHRGSISIAIAEGTNATLSIAAGTGRFASEFPVEKPENGKRRFTITLGTGSASVELESFGGRIMLRRPWGEDGEPDA